MYPELNVLAHASCTHVLAVLLNCFHSIYEELENRNQVVSLLANRTRGYHELRVRARGFALGLSSAPGGQACQRLTILGPP